MAAFALGNRVPNYGVASHMSDGRRSIMERPAVQRHTGCTIGTGSDRKSPLVRFQNYPLPGNGLLIGNRTNRRTEAEGYRIRIKVAYLWKCHLEHGVANEKDR